jgi:uncharacterized membrane protein
MNINSAHVHLLMNHLPIIGTAFGLLLLAAGIIRRSDDLKKAGLTTFALAAIITLPVYLTGEPAEEIVEGLPGVSEAIVEEHEDAALIASIACGVLGALAAFGLVRSWRKQVPAWIATSALALSLIVSGLMMWTGSLGGQIRHTEVRGGAAAPVTPPAERERDDDR